MTTQQPQTQQPPAPGDVITYGYIAGRSTDGMRMCRNCLTLSPELHHGICPFCESHPKILSTTED